MLRSIYFSRRLNIPDHPKYKTCCSYFSLFLWHRSNMHHSWCLEPWVTHYTVNNQYNERQTLKKDYGSNLLTGSVWVLSLIPERPDLGPACSQSPCSSSKVRTEGDINRRWFLGWVGKKKTSGFLPFSPLTPRGENFPCAALTHSGFCRPRRPLYLSPRSGCRPGGTAAWMSHWVYLSGRVASPLSPCTLTRVC